MAKKKVLKAKGKAKPPKKVAKAAKKPALKVVARKANGNGNGIVGSWRVQTSNHDSTNRPDKPRR